MYSSCQVGSDTGSPNDINSQVYNLQSEIATEGQTMNLSTWTCINIRQKVSGGVFVYGLLGQCINNHTPHGC